MTGNFMSLCERRQSCRKYADRPVEREKLMACMEAARLAPSACNSQPWHFYLVSEPGIVKKVAMATQEADANPTMDTAKAFVVITEEYAKLAPTIRGLIDSQYYAHGDVGAAAAIICFEAEDQGLGSCILGSFNREKICRALDIPQEKRIRLVVALGYPENSAVREKARKKMEEILTIYE
jgi:nitroreductase